MKKAMITGASGMVGGLVLQQCLESDEIDQVISIGRRPTGLVHEKLLEINHSNFLDYAGLESHFENVDIAYYCIGVYTGAVPDNVFQEITVGFTKAFSTVLEKKSPQATCCFLSGQGADPLEKSRVSFARYKGMAENHLRASSLDHVYIFRPSYIYPVERRKEPNMMYKVSRFLYPVIKLFGTKMSIRSTELAKAMFDVGLSGGPKQIMENADIISVVKSIG